MSEAKPLLVCGIDFGSALIKASSEGKDFVSPSVAGESNEGWSGMGSDPSWENNLSVYMGVDEENHVHKLFFGELARTQSEVKRVLTKGGRVAEVEDVELAIKVSLVVMGVLTGKLDGNNPDIQETDCVITVGVPVSTTVEKMKQLSAALKGVKEIVVENDFTKKVVQVRLNITSCMIVYGPYGSYYQMLNEFNESTAVDAVITDIGYGSAEILTIYEGKPNVLASASISDLSLETLANRVAIALQQQTGRIIKGIDLMRVLQQDKPRVIIAGENLDITEIKNYYVANIVKGLTDEIIQRVTQLPPDARVKYYIFTGDGVELFWKDLELNLFQRNLIQDINQAAHPKDYKIANARGFENIARARTQ